MKQSKRFNRLALYFSLMLLTILFLHDPILTAYGNWLAPSDKNPEADIAVVVDSSQPRIDTGVRLLLDRKVKSLFISSIPYKRLEELIVKHNLPPEQVYWGGCKEVATTFDQPPTFVNKVLKDAKTPYRSIVLITNSYHLRRSLWTYRRILGSDFEIKTFAVNDPREHRFKWWRYGPSRRWVSSETQKIIFYWIYYGLLGNTTSTDIPYQDFFDQKGTGYDPQKMLAVCDD